jgi:periplasmic protein TonB
MFAPQEQRSIAGVVSIIVHAGVVAAAFAGARHADVGVPPIVIAESLLVVPTSVPAGPVSPISAPVIGPVTVPVMPGPPDLPGIPALPIGSPGPEPAGATVTDSGGDPGVFLPAVIDEPPALLSAPLPVYPPLLRLAGIQGWVTVQAIVDTMGRAEPGSLRVVDSPNPGFDRAALDCVRRALFRPGRVTDRAVRVLVSVPLHFTLRP